MQTQSSFIQLHFTFLDFFLNYQIIMVLISPSLQEL